FMQISGEKNSLSFIEFFSSVFVIQNNAVIPLIILTYIIGLKFYSEKEKGQLYFYKDISRNDIFNSKLLSLITLYIMFVIVLFLSSLFLYYFHITSMDLASNEFWPKTKADLQYVLIEFFGVLFLQIICIYLAVLLSINLPNGYTILGVLAFFIVSSIAPFLKSLKYIFPNGYQEKLNNQNFSSVFFIITIIFIIYISILYIISIYQYRKMEF
ncbi:hypothetical protein WL735_11685, partial [Staphylococcus hominis]